MASKDKKKAKTLKENLEERNFNLKEICNIVAYSINGIKSYAKEGKSIVLYSIAFIIEVILGFSFSIDGKEWILLICMLGILLSIELLNTAIEKTCDAITKEYNPCIKIAKDCGSAATFVVFILLLFLNIVIFYPKVVALF